MTKLDVLFYFILAVIFVTWSTFMLGMLIRDIGASIAGVIGTAVKLYYEGEEALFQRWGGGDNHPEDTEHSPSPYKN